METHPVIERHSFIEDLEDGESMAELCRRHGISRKTGYKWKERYEVAGPAALVDQPRRAKTLPHKTSPETAELILGAKHRHPTWGPKKLVRLLEREHPDRDIPAPSTASEILRRHGLVVARPKRRRSRIWSSPPLRKVEAPNDTWTIDFKGHFRLVRGPYCYPLTVQDAFSRYIFRCDALKGTDSAPVKTAMEAVFREFGLPYAMRSDNGTPFAVNRGCLGLSDLSLWWLKLGIKPERIERGCPQQNGRHERMHRTLKADTVPQRTFEQQQSCFDAFRSEFNEERPHESLGFATPASAYTRSPRPMPERPPRFEYDSRFEVRRVAHNGSITFEGGRYYLSTVLATEDLGLTQLSGNAWQVWIGVLPVGYIDAASRRFEPYEGTARRLETTLTS